MVDSLIEKGANVDHADEVSARDEPSWGEPAPSLPPTPLDAQEALALYHTRFFFVFFLPPSVLGGRDGGKGGGSLG